MNLKKEHEEESEDFFNLKIEKPKVSLERMDASSDSSFDLENFVEGFPLISQKKQSWNKDFDPLDYSSKISNQDSPKYTESYKLDSFPEKVKIEELESFKKRKPDFIFNPLNKIEEKSVEYYSPIKKEDFSEIGKQIFEIKKKPEIKYISGKS